MVFLVVFGLYLDPFLESGLAFKLASRHSVFHWKQMVHLEVYVPREVMVVPINT